MAFLLVDSPSESRIVGVAERLKTCAWVGCGFCLEPRLHPSGLSRDAGCVTDSPYSPRDAARVLGAHYSPRVVADDLVGLTLGTLLRQRRWSPGGELPRICDPS